MVSSIELYLVPRKIKNPNMYIQIESFLSILVGSIGVFVIFLVIFSYKYNISINIFLVFLFAIVSTRMLTHGLVGLQLFSLHPNYHTFFKPLSLIGIPSFYLYLYSLLKDMKFLKKENLLHLIFPVLNVILNFLQTKFEVLRNDIIEISQTVGTVLFLLGYLVATILVLKKITDKILKPSKKRNAEHQLVISRWMIFIVTVALVSGMKLLLTIFYEYQSGSFVTGTSFFVVNVILWGLTFGYILSNTEILFGFPNLKTDSKEKKQPILVYRSMWILEDKLIENKQDKALYSTLHKKNLQYIEHIEQFITTHTPFRDPKYKIKDLAKDLNVPSSHIAFVFKYYSNLSFIEFRNTMRIYDAIQLLEKDFLADKTLEALAKQVGFTSYNPFYMAFKKETNKSPAEYLLRFGGNTDE